MDGPGSARAMAKYLKAKMDWTQIRCRYIKPHVVCTAIAPYPGGHANEYIKVKVTVHKTSPKRGFSTLCYPALDICTRQPHTFSR